MTAIKTERYNGWTNRQTLNVALWFGNDESLYRAVLAHGRFLNLIDTREFVKYILPDGTKDFDGPEDYKNVCWMEIRACFNEMIG